MLIPNTNQNPIESVSRNKRKNSLDDLEEQINIENKKKLELEKLAEEKKTRLWPILKEKKLLIISAAFFACMAGAIWPVFGILQADSMDSMSKQDLRAVKEENFMIAMYFLLLSVSAGVAYFMEK